MIVPFDTNALANPVVPQPANILDQAASAIQLRNALLGNKIQQAEYDGRVARGKAYADHYNALTGQYDMPAVQSEMGSSAAGQYGLPEAVTTIRSQQAQQIGNDQAQLELNGRRMGMIAGIVSPYANKPNLTKQDLAPAYGAAIAHGIMSIDQANQSYAALPEGGDALKQQVRGLLDSAAGPGHAYNDAYGEMSLVDVGGHLQWQNVGSPASGQGGVDQGAPIKKTLTPGENATLAPVMVRDPKTGVLTPSVDTAEDIRQRISGGGSGFTGRRVDTAGAPEPVLTGAPVGYDEQVKNGIAVQSALNHQQGDVTANIATLRNLNGLLGRLRDQQFRGHTMGQIAGNLAKMGLPDNYATLSQEIDKAGTTLRHQLMDGGTGPHTNAGLADLDHITPGADMTPTAARALTNEMLTAAEMQQRRGKVAAGIKDPTQVLNALGDYDANFEPRFSTIQRLGPEEGREYAKSHIEDPSQYFGSVYRMAKAQRDKGYDYGLTPEQMKSIISRYEAQDGGR